MRVTTIAAVDICMKPVRPAAVPASFGLTEMAPAMELVTAKPFDKVTKKNGALRLNGVKIPDKTKLNINKAPAIAMRLPISINLSKLGKV